MNGAPAIEEALTKLIAGNKRFSSGKASHPNQGTERRAEAAKGQRPFAVVVGCSDSRIPPEIIFDQGIGDLFIIRVAGNVVDDIALGSIEYAVEHLGARLIVVLGHSKCGAVTATVQGGEVHGHIGSIVKAIQPAVDKAKGRPGDLTDNSIRANVQMVVQTIVDSKPALAPLVDAGSIRVVGAYYDIGSGKVEMV
jgi:carbonic anhydrase